MAPDKEALESLRIERPPTRPRGRGPARLLWTILVLLAIGGAAAWWFQRSRAIPVQTAIAREISSASASGGHAGSGPRVLLNASGYVTARRQATVSSKVTGLVTEILFEEGAQVEEGQELARLDDTNVRASLRLAEAQLESTRRAMGETEALLEQAERTLTRTRQLMDAKGVSISELDRAVAEAASLRARIDRQRADIVVAEREVALWQQQLEDTRIRAPFAGVITSKNAQPGEMISPISAGGGFTRTGIGTIVDMSSLEIEVDVNESYINRVQPGQPVIATLDSYPEWPIPAQVIAIIPTADRQKATVRVRIGFEALDPRILPDMGLKAAFLAPETPAATEAAATAEGSPALVVPRRAVRRAGEREIVWLVRDGRLERRAVTVSQLRGDQAAIAGGLSAGDRVVVDGPADLAEGLRVAEQSPSR